MSLLRQNDPDSSVLFPNERTKVIVIGAGASGIGAARAVYQSGLDCIVLEARDRTGGRVHKAVMHPNLVEENDELKRDNTVTVQLGANWIHGLKEDINPMFAVAKKLGLVLHLTSSDDEPGDDVLLFDEVPQTNNENIDDISYKTVDPDDYKAVLQRYDWIREHFDEVFAMCECASTSKCSLLDAFQASISASEEVFGKCSSLQRRCLNWLLDRVAIDMANPLSAVSPQTYIEGDSCGQYGEALVISGGYYRILDHLIKEFPIDIRLNSVVSSIEQDPETRLIHVRLTSGQLFIADSCIVTVPIGVLKHHAIDFAPNIPRCIQSVTNSAMDMGLMNLVWLWFPYQFWPDGYNFFGIARSSLSQESMFTTFLAPKLQDRFGNSAAILMCQVIGPFAERAESMSEELLADEATKVLRNMFASSEGQMKAHPRTGVIEVPKAIGCRRSQWRSEQFSTGSWSFFPFQSSSLNETLETEDFSASDDSWKDILFYAGEATNEDYRGTVHGAYLSGTNSAKRAVRHLAGKYPPMAKL